MSNREKVLLAILDGWGRGEESQTNAVYMAATPNMDRWSADYPSTTLVAHGEAVGLPAGQMGNSEVGHLNIGAGRIVYQDLTRINLALKNGDFFKNQILIRAMTGVREKGSVLHLMGLVSDGGVHSHLDHLVGLLEMAKRNNLENVFVHAFMDGRDTPPHSGAQYMRQLQDAMQRIGVGKVATISGRYYAMDRDNRWDRVHLAWQALVDGKGVFGKDSVLAIDDAYKNGETDEFIKPVVLTDGSGKPLAVLKDYDSVVFFNFRADRARQLTHAFTDQHFAGFVPVSRPQLAEYVTFTGYDQKFDLPVAFPPVSLSHILGEEVSDHGLRQLRIAETEKYAHVTFFFNGGREEPFANEDRVLVPSPREVATYDLKPEMSAFGVTDELLPRISQGVYDLIVLNFANGDMVGHSGDLSAAITACEAVDQCLGRVVEAFTQQGGTVLITADHGNAEIMFDLKNGEPFTAHTSNPVPFIMVGDKYKECRMRTDGSLKDIAPTVLDILRIEVPVEMEGLSLIVE
ncbi:MAG: 2,3-bisphosphoglycerate-independent phosphoglycerate mutase [Proteobacteria bacterium]|nr:2,3-bisphosphoglycerate-independent phosphoglycerate mutase [Pseudomonadota bacterium]MBU1716347.1 2,3-bisphosphoglycerate-independent phosphoglycerate mutase [Pseudomonadota bacterium]